MKKLSVSTSISQLWPFLKQKYVFFLFLNLLFLSSCNQEFISSKTSSVYNDDATIQEAKQWYREHIESPKNARSNANKIKEEPAWNKAVDYGHYIEVPMMYDGDIPSIVLYQGDYNSLPKKGKVIDRKESYGQVTLVIAKFKDSYVPHLVKIIPTEEYAITNKNLLKKGQITVETLLENKFSGVVLHTDLDGGIKAGYQMQDGKNVREFDNLDLLNIQQEKKKGSRQSAILDQQPQCYDVYEVTYARDCVDGNCGNWYVTGTTFLYSYCAPNDGGGGGSGSSSTPSGGTGVQSSGPLPRNSETLYNVLNKFLCSIPNNINIHVDYTNTYEARLAGILREENGAFTMMGGSRPIGVTGGTYDSKVSIWLSQDAFEHGEFYLASIIGHEMVHAQNEIAGRGQQGASEYAAYTWSKQFYERHYELVKQDPFLKREESNINSRLNQYYPSSNSSYTSNPCN